MKSGLKQEKLSVWPFKLRSSFYTSRGGGSEAPIRRIARWGLLANCHGTSLKNFNFNPRVCFYDYFCVVFVTLWLVCEKMLKRDLLLRQTLAYDCQSAKHFHMRQRQLLVAQMPRYTGGFNH